MRTSALKMIPAFFLITLSILILATLRAGAAESGYTDNIVQNSATVAKGKTLSPSDTEKRFLIKESAFREFFKRGKDKLQLFGQKLTFVFSNYSEIPSEIVQALNHLTGGKGPGHLAEVFLLFLLMLAIGFGYDSAGHALEGSGADNTLDYKRAGRCPGTGTVIRQQA